VQQIVKEELDLTILEVAEEFWRRSGTKVSCSAMGRTLRQLGLTRKKSLTATEQAEPRIQELRRRFIELAKKLDPRRLVFIDEAGSHIAMTREYARAPRGEPSVAPSMVIMARTPATSSAPSGQVIGAMRRWVRALCAGTVFCESLRPSAKRLPRGPKPPRLDLDSAPGVEQLNEGGVHDSGRELGLDDQLAGGAGRNAEDV
jgi:hypothetical protein